MKKASIQVQDITFSYGKQKAVRGISFEVAPGEILGFLGPNGAGKSTTIKMLTGQLVPDSGTIHILNTPIRGHNSEVHARMGVCFEEKNLYLQMTGRENLQFFAKLYGIRNPNIDRLLQQVDLWNRAKDRVSSYSKGMRQRLMIARSLIHDPEVLFLDEPTDGLDPVSAKAIRDIILERSNSGTAILLTTHDMNEADKLSHRVAFINEGKLYALDTPENLKLSHGSRSASVRIQQGKEIIETSITLDTNSSADELKKTVSSGKVLTIHTEEATLEDIFIAMTGRGLQ